MIGTVAPATAEEPKSGYARDARTLFFGCLRLADLAMLAVTGLFSYWARNGVIDLPADAWWVIMTACLIAANALHFGKAYSFGSLRRRSRHLSSIALAWTASVLVMIALLYFTKTGERFSRGWMLTWGVTSLAGFVVLRSLCWGWLAHWRRKGVFVFEVAVIGEAGAAERLARRIEETGEGDVHVIGVFRPRREGPDDSATGDLADLMQLSRSARIDEIAVAIPCSTGLDLSAVIGALSILPVDVKLCIDLSDPLPFAAGSFCLPAVLLSSRPVAGWSMVVKRGMDIALSATLLLLLAPVLLVTAAFIKLDSPGPAIFRQQRFGFNKQPITIYKFRTMHVAASTDATAPQATRNDPRVTRLGRFLRSSSLDELPQLVNVLMGNMSLVGPRPHAIAHDEHYAQLIDGYLGRHRVKPGMTGWAQTNGYRGETDTIEKMQGRLQHDLYYIAHWSPLFDLQILARTLFVGFYNKNAY